MTGNLLRFEIKYHMRHASFYIASFFALLISFLSSNVSGGGNLVHLNSPYSTIFHSTQLSAMLTIFVVTVFAVYAALRDREYVMESLIYSTSIDKFKYLFTRFFGLVISSTIVMFMCVLGLFLLPLAPWIDSSQLGDISILPYLWAMFIVIFPNVLFVSSLVFATAIFTKSTIFTYVSGLFIYSFYVIVSMLSNSPVIAQSTGISPENMSLAILLDPYAYIAFYDQSHYWSASQKNTLLPSLSGYYLFNRLLWVGVSLSIYSISYYFFKFRVLKKEKKNKQEDSFFKPNTSIPYRAVSVEQDKQIKAMFSKIKIEFLTVIKGIPFIILMILLTLLVFVELSETIAKGAYGMVPYYPHTGLILPILQEPISKIGVIIVILYSAELYWIERKVKINELIDSSGTANIFYFFAKFFAVLLIIVTIIFISIVLAVLFQLYHSYYQIDFMLYLSLFYHAGLVLVLYSIFTFFIQNFAKNKIIGIGISILIVFGYKQVIAAIFQGVHPLFLFAFQPEFMYSDMLKEAYYANSTNMFNLYWATFSFMLIVLTISFWKRGYHKLRFKITRNRKILLAISIIAFLFFASSIYYKMNVVNDYKSNLSKNNFSAEYERKYSKYKEMNLPTITDINLKIDLFPDDRKYQVEGTYILENKSNEEISKLLVSVRKQNRTTYNVSIPGARLENSDGESQMYWYQLDKALKPEEKTKLIFSQTVIVSEYDNLDSENYILSNGSYVEISKYIPNLGYDTSYELTNPNERRKRGLPEYQEMMTFTKDTIFPNSDNWWNYEAVISTKASQSIVSQGRLINEWEKDKRRYFHFKSEKKMRPMLAFSSARYKREKLIHNGIEVSLYYHPEHYQNIQTMMEAAKHTLDYSIKNFGPYQYSHLKMAELPDFSNTFAGTAYPNTVYFVENRCFNVNQTDTNLLNVAYSVTAHEIAHQWWGHKLVPAYMAGYRFQTETLAEYTELAILEEKFGRKQVEIYLDDAMRRYTSTRRWANSVEESLEQVQDQFHVAYFKGIMVMNGIKGLLGEAKVNLALNNFYKKYQYPIRPKSTDLINELYSVSDTIEQGILDDYLKRTVFHKFKFESAELRELENSQYELTANLSGQKTIFYEDKEKSEELNEYIELAGFMEKPVSGLKPAFLKRMHFKGDSSFLKIILNHKIKYLVIDPDKHRIEINRSDNIYELK